MLASIPSPPSQVLSLGGFEIRYYGLMIALGVLVAVSLARRRWKALGGDPDIISDIAVWAVPAGLVGARLWHVVTDWNLHDGDPWWWPIAIWQGGLGIPGGVMLGALGGYLAAKHYGVDVPRCADVMVPAIPIAQAIGRLGNYFNQEVYGRPTTLPWGLEIDPEVVSRSTPQYVGSTTFHPTFLYEGLWNLGAAGFLIWLDSKRILRRGKILPLYFVAYFCGRIWVEALRSDHANEILGLRVNTWTSILAISIGTAWFLWGGALRPQEERGVLDLLPGAAEAASPEAASADATSGEVLGEDGVVEGGPEVDRPLAEVTVAEGGNAEAGDGVDPDEGS